MEDGCVDVLLSVFGVVFAPDPAAAAAEMARVTSAQARIVISAWLPEGPIRQVVQMARETEMAALDAAPVASPFAWHDAGALSELLAPHGFSVDIEPQSHVFTAASIDDYLQAELVDHPLWVASRAMLEARGEGHVQTEIVDRAREILTTGNESPGGFAVTSPYVVATAQRS